MTGGAFWTFFGIAVHVMVELALIVRVLLRPHRDPASRIAWIVVILVLPVLGILSYLLFGEVNIGRRRVERVRKILAGMPPFPGPASGNEANLRADVPPHLVHLFHVGRSISGFEPVGGNTASLLADSNAAIESLVKDIDSAREHVHLLFYIWLADRNGLAVVEGLKRAASRGVTCRAMADDLGSKAIIRSRHWKEMSRSGVRLAAALPVGNPLLRPLHGRIDLRNHRKIVVIDGRITYCGSQNCADPEFRVKAKFAPWVDIMARFEGPVAAQNQRLFVSDWMSGVDEDLRELLGEPVMAPNPGVTAQVIGTGPTVRYSAMPEMFETLIYTARRELVITTPYYVPDDAMQGALCAAAHRGVDARIVFPERNDSWIVSAASRSYYWDLLSAGVEIYEFPDGLLHAKTLTVDGEITLIGSANMDRRSFDLNYENNILCSDRHFTAQVRRRQQDYLERAHRVSQEVVRHWPPRRRLWNNTIAMLGPLL